MTKMTDKAALRWHSVETPSVFLEYALPEDESAWTAPQRAQWAELADVAERHGTYVQSHSYRRG